MGRDQDGGSLPCRSRLDCQDCSVIDFEDPEDDNSVAQNLK